MHQMDNIYFAASEIAGIHFNVFASHAGIRHIIMNNKGKKIGPPNLVHLHEDDPFMFNVFGELLQYFNCERKKFSVPLDLQGTEFQLKVWHELLKIPYGKVTTYKAMAEKLADEKLIRAVGGANGANPVPVIVPCHRVINTGGGLGGYSAGLDVKRQLLELEGARSMELF